MEDILEEIKWLGGDCGFMHHWLGHRFFAESKEAQQAREDEVEDRLREWGFVEAS